MRREATNADRQVYICQWRHIRYITAAIVTCNRHYNIIDGEYVTPGSGSGHCISRQGRGTQELTNGMTYTGVWAGDRMSGEGEQLIYIISP